MKIHVISDNVDTATGMRLAGMETVVVHEKEELIGAFEDAFKDPEIGIILLTEIFERNFPEVVNNYKATVSTPLIISIPDRHGTGRSEDFITSYVNRAIGLKL